MTCSRCHQPHTRKGQRFCAKCHAANMREWRKTHPLGAGQRKRDAARSYANTYKRRGILVQEPCCVCGSAKSEMHHPDHELPLVVVWLCREHHLAWHSFWRLHVKLQFEQWLNTAARNVTREKRIRSIASRSNPATAEDALRKTSPSPAALNAHEAGALP
jgi:hypothetical protein